MSAEDLYQEGEQLRIEGKYDEAAAKFEAALAEDDQYVLAYLALAVVYGKLGRHEEAITQAQRACELDPTDSFHFTALSVTYKRAFDGTQDPKYIQLAEDAMARAHAVGGQ